MLIAVQLVVVQGRVACLAEIWWSADPSPRKLTRVLHSLCIRTCGRHLPTSFQSYCHIEVQNLKYLKQA